MSVDEGNFGKYPYVTLNEIKNYLDITSDNHNGKLSNLAGYACGVVEHYIGREVLANNYTETFDGGKSSVFISRMPVSNVFFTLLYLGNTKTHYNVLFCEFFCFQNRLFLGMCILLLHLLF